MKKYIFIGNSRHSYRTSTIRSFEKLSNYNKNLIDCMDGYKMYSLDYNLLENNYDKIIFGCQDNRVYPFRISNKLFLNKKYIFFTRRKELTGVMVNSATNGFSVYTSWKSHKLFLLNIASSNKDYIKNPLYDDVTYGFYNRPTTELSFIIFLNKLKEYNKKVNLVFCGYKPDFNYIKSNVNVGTIKHTENMEEFWNSITHYVMPMNPKIFDPFPHTLLEAVQNKKQVIIIPCERNFSDGIDDIMSLIQYHTSFYDSNIVNNDSNILTYETLIPYYNRLFSNNFEYHFDYTKYKTFYDWCSHEL